MCFLENKQQREVLGRIMDFDHVVRVHEDGSVTDAMNAYAPEVYGENISQFHGDGWEWLDGYSRQDGYSGPIMHPSEYIGGKMADDIRETPGLYVAVVVDCDHHGSYGCDPEDVEAGDCEPLGWGVLHMPDEGEQD